MYGYVLMYTQVPEALDILLRGDVCRCTGVGGVKGLGGGV